MTRPTWTYLRPFPNAHWTLAVGFLLAFVIVLTMAGGCERPLASLVAPMFAMLAVVCLWLADLRRGDRTGWRRVAWVGWHGVGDMLTFGVVLFAAMFVALPFLEGADCMNGRAYTSVIVQLSAGPKMEIAERAQARGTLAGSGVGTVLPSSSETEALGLITPDGTILWAIPRSGAVLILTPSLIKGKVTWRCQGRPARVVPSSCRYEEDKSTWE